MNLKKKSFVQLSTLIEVIIYFGVLHLSYQLIALVQSAEGMS